MMSDNPWQPIHHAEAEEPWEPVAHHDDQPQQRESRKPKRKPEGRSQGKNNALALAYSVPATFMAVTNSSRDAPYVVAGLPLDLGTSLRSGQREGPFAIRRASRLLGDTTYPKPVLGGDLSDVGDFRIAPGDLEKSIEQIEQQAAGISHLIGLGGEHTITLPLLRALVKSSGPVGMVHFDAHRDLADDNDGEEYGHASVFRQAINEALIDPKRMIQVGLRCMDEPDNQFADMVGIRHITSEDIHTGQPSADVIRETVGSGPTYLSFDIDCLDPSCAPGTGTPVTGGLFTWQAQSLLRLLKGVNFVGMDLVEVAPAYDWSEITALAAATIIWEYLDMLNSGAAE
jgi:agmatinase